ncbi:MAG: transposase [Flavobacteriales bacterium]|nr:transposase [Flavobacteriales bacterium]
MKNEKFKNKYRIASTRLQTWDYRWAGAYFITICTKNRRHYFGEVRDRKMYLSNLGILADVFWYEIKNHTKDVELGAFVVMPDHVHGILFLNGAAATPAETETLHATSLSQSLPRLRRNNPNEFFSKISPKSGSVSTIIRSYKSAVTKHANRLGMEFAWQARFHDIIIRNQRSLKNISDYIIDNPANWGKPKIRRATRPKRFR